MEQQTFIPIIRNAETDSASAAKQQLRSIYSTALHIESCALAVAKFKTNGSVHGHRILDDDAAAIALADAAPQELAKQIEGVRLSRYEKTQVLNQVLRRHFEMDKAGKLTGQPSARLRLKSEA